MPRPTIDPEDDRDEPRADMTPLIDLVFLLLVFLILTTRFVPDEDVLHQLLASKDGQHPTPSAEEPQDVAVTLYPAGLDAHRPIEELQAAAERPLAHSGMLTVRIDGRELLIDTATPEDDQLERLHGFLAETLSVYELPGERDDQDPVVIHAVSGLPWRYAMWVYDATRHYEMERMPAEVGIDQVTGAMGSRQISFAPPRIRGYSQFERGHELREIMTMH